LDAAERAFAENGYAASLRDIASDAGVRLGMVHYHFGNKEDLLKAAVARREPAMLAVLEESFSEMEAAACPRLLSVEETIAAFLRPFLVIRVSPGHELRDYIAMRSHLMSAYRVPEVRRSLVGIDAITNPLLVRLRTLLPNVRDADLYAGVYLLLASIIYMVQDPGFADDVTRGHYRVAELDRLLDPAVRLFAAGIASLSIPAPSSKS
jgi:AcrR family transcriptional regulator